ncbi:MAG: FAD-dependent oxidoreductase [Promethearchaeota archaeon]
MENQVEEQIKAQIENIVDIQTQNLTQKKVMVIGGGIAGIQASLDLANNGFHVDLVERTPSIGGRMAQMDKTFPTNDCSICILAPKLSDCSRHPNIKIHSLTEVTKVSKENNDFNVSLYQKARYVHEDLCINCKQCLSVCPTKVDDEFDMQMRKRKAIYLYYLQGVPAVMAIDKDHCIYLTYHRKHPESEKKPCQLCQKACSKNAIDFTMTDKEFSITTNAIILATGYDQFDPSVISKYGYGKYKNVVKGLEFERMLCASGPTKGIVQRLSDSRHPKTLAFIQCVGSRDIHYNPYCSAVCCTYTTKEAILAYDHDPNIEIFIFYIDIRAGEKGFQKYINRAKNECGVHYIKGKISDIQIDEDENPILYYENLITSEMHTKKVDFVVLESAMIKSYGSENLQNTMHIEGDKYHFVKTSETNPVSTTVPGIFACGCCRGPRDIPFSVIDASGAAAKAEEYIQKFSD